MRTDSSSPTTFPCLCASVFNLALSLVLIVFVCHSSARAQEAFAGVARTEVFKSGTNGYHTFRIPSIIRTQEGSLLAFCEGRKKGRADSGDIDLVMRRSDDLGATWSDLTIVWDDADNTVGNPCPVVDSATGAIHLLLTWNSGKLNEKKIKPGFGEDSRRVFVMHSSDDGQSWSKPRELTRDVKRPEWSWYATGPGAGIEIARGPHRGRLVIPCDHKLPAGKETSYHSHIIYSDDHGATWEIGGVAPEDDGNECEVVELIGGRLMLNMRNYDRQAKTRQVAFSEDGGESWSDQQHDAVLIEPICQASIRRVRWPERESPGVLLFSNPADADLRRRLTVRGSRDEGKTWDGERVLFAGVSAYSCLVSLSPESAGCLYEADDYGRILFDRFAVDWVLEGEGMKATAAP